MNKTPDELIKFAAVEMCGAVLTNTWVRRPDILNAYQFPSGVVIELEKWNPLKDSNQLDMIEAELVKLGLNVDSKHNDIYFITIQHVTKDGKGHVTTLSNLRCNGDDVDQIRLTKLTAYVEAMEKFKELK